MACVGQLSAEWTSRGVEPTAPRGPGSSLCSQLYKNEDVSGEAGGDMKYGNKPVIFHLEESLLIP